jgi:hypothetical protein
VAGFNRANPARRARRLLRIGPGVGACWAAVLDALMIIGVALTIPSVTWVAAGAMAASAGRIAVSARSLRPVRAG